MRVTAHVARMAYLLWLKRKTGASAAGLPLDIKAKRSCKSSTQGPSSESPGWGAGSLSGYAGLHD